QLFAHHLIVPVDIPGGGYVPALPAEDLSLAQVYLAIRHRRPAPDRIKATAEMDPSQMHVIDRVEQMVSNGLAQQTLKDLISSGQPNSVSTLSSK
ncbi:Rrf2 family transcriptional regulator, partial [Gammaproteobacteria bacterium]|nr:Rrf2 family transcriptional regulator [Gammaproteobacteria bacterium]